MSRTGHVGARGYLVVWGATMALALASYLVSFVRLGGADLLVALGIAGAKAALVALFFMHLVEQRTSNRIVLVVAVGYVALLAGLTGLDVATRHTFPPAPRWGDEEAVGLPAPPPGRSPGEEPA